MLGAGAGEDARMSESGLGEITELLLAWSGGETSALDKLVPLVYAELRRLAHRYMRGEPQGHTLETSALVNEAYLRLVDSSRVHWRDRVHFLAVSAQLMRRVLVDFARARRSQRRGGDGQRVTLTAAANLPAQSVSRSTDLVQLDELLTTLAATEPRRAQVIEMRYFGGLSVQETAEALGVSDDTVMRDWRLARVWLLRAMKRERMHAG
jgi:RNA polymerase sigma factor (TIGR02999 family)